MKYNDLFYLFMELTCTGEPRQRIFALDGSNNADSRKGVPFGSLVDIAPHLLCSGSSEVPLP